MSNEARVVSSLQVKVGASVYQSQPTGFNAAVSVANGPCVGTVAAHVHGTRINLSQMALPGLFRIMNQDSALTLELGLWDTAHSRFLPFLDLLPGETYVGRLSAKLSLEYGTGSGTGSGFTGAVTQLMVRGVGGTVNALVEVFDT